MKSNQVLWLIIFICAGVFLAWRMSSSEAGRSWQYPVNHSFTETGTKVEWEPIKRLDHGEGPAVTEYVVSTQAKGDGDQWTDLETAHVRLENDQLVYPSRFMDPGAADQQYRVIAKSGDKTQEVPVVVQQVYESIKLPPDQQYIVHPEEGDSTPGWTRWEVVKSAQGFQASFAANLKAAGLPEDLADDPEQALAAINSARGLPDAMRDTLLNNVDQSRNLSISLSGTIGLWLSAIFTLCIMSFLYRDNLFYKFAEAVVVGASAAYVMAVGFWTMIVKNLFSNLVPSLMKDTMLPGMPIGDVWEGLDFSYIVPAVFIVLLLWRLMPAGGWVSRWPLAFFIGITAGLRLIAFLEADFMAQIGATMIPLWVPVQDAAGGVIVWDSIWASFTNIVIIAATVTGLIYFFFSVEHKGMAGRAAKVGIWFLMITFGAGFGYTVMGRIALLSERLQYLFGNWLDFIDKV